MIYFKPLSRIALCLIFMCAYIYKYDASYMYTSMYYYYRLQITIYLISIRDKGLRRNLDVI